ncbi:MAG: hypothetical protein ACE5NC_04295 [Anaerolineae bacterium]
MDKETTGPLLAWLDEAQRKDRAQIEELRKLVEAQTGQLAATRKEISKLQGQLSRLKGELARTPSVADTAERIREMTDLIRQSSQQELRRIQREIVSLREGERETLSRSLERLETEIQDRMERHLGAESLRTEMARLHEMVLAVQPELDSLGERAVAQERALSHVEKAVDRLRAKAGQLESGREVDRREHAEGLEKFQALEGEWRREMEEFRGEMASWRDEAVDRQEAMTEMHRLYEEASEILEMLRSVEDEWEARRGELEAVQGLAEKRLKKLIDEWREEQEERWARNAAHWDRLGNEMDKREERIGEMWATLSKFVKGQMAGEKAFAEGLEAWLRGEK